MPTLPARRHDRGLATRPRSQEFEDVRDRMDRLFEDLLRGDPLDVAAAWAPPVDIEETEDAWILEAEIPGAEAGDVNVEVNDNEVVIRGDIKQRERKGVLRRRARRVGNFEFRATLPGEIDAEKVDASLNNGVLTVRVPKSERAQPRRIEVRPQ